MKQRKNEAKSAQRGRKTVGYFFRRFFTNGQTKHAAVNDPLHAKAEIWFCFMTHGWRRSLNLHTHDLKTAQRRSRSIHHVIHLTDHEKFLKEVVRLGLAADKALQQSIGDRMENATKPKTPSKKKADIK